MWIHPVETLLLHPEMEIKHTVMCDLCRYERESERTKKHFDSPWGCLCWSSLICSFCPTDSWCLLLVAHQELGGCAQKHVIEMLQKICRCESAKILINQTKKVKLSLKLTLSSSWSGAAPCSSSFSGEDPSRSYWRSRTVSDKLVSRWTLINMTSVWLLTRVHEQYLTRCVKAEEAEERKQASPLI